MAFESTRSFHPILLQDCISGLYLIACLNVEYNCNIQFTSEYRKQHKKPRISTLSHMAPHPFL